MNKDTLALAGVVTGSSRGKHQANNPLIRKLENFVRLSPADRAMLSTLSAGNVHDIRARNDLVHQGEKPHHVTLILEGWCCRYKVLEDGRRQIVGFFIPGDLCDPNVFVLQSVDHSLSAITAVRYAQVSREHFDRIDADYPRLVEALRWEALVSAAIQSEWTMNVGQRSAHERLANLVCELFVRLRAVGLTQGYSFELPLTQSELADATGMTAVHVNRTLQDMRRQTLIEWKGREVRIPDFDRLAHYALFNPNYLHLGHEGAQLDAAG